MLVLYTFLFLVAFVCFVATAFNKNVRLLEVGLAAVALVWFLQSFTRL